MKYLTEIIFAAVVCGLITLVTPDGKSNIGKYVKYAATLAFICMSVSPLISIPESLPEIFSDISSIYEDPNHSENTPSESVTHYGNLDIVSSEICKAAANSAAEHFGVPESDFCIKLIIDKTNSEYSIRSATVYPKGKASEIEKETLKKYFKKIFNSPVEVIYSGN